MKVCPECQARFDGGEAFCPNDGTKLVAARDLSPGELTGLDLTEHIHLERLEFCDDLGERYAGELAPDAQPVRVTVFNQGFRPEAERAEALDKLRAELDGPLPPEILSLHSVELDDEHPHVVEEAPKGPSLKSLLDERKALDWQTAVRLVCRVGRALQYLADQGLVHLGLHSQAIFVTKLQEGSIQLGEWAQGVLSHRERPLDWAEEHPEDFLGYTAYLAPETIRDASDADERTLVYMMGMLLYELIAGKPPFTSKSPDEALKRHLHEKPLKLSIARGGSGLHPDIDDVLEMMWKKAPERRFQNPQAAIAALGSMLDEGPDDIAPALQTATSAVFGEASSEAKLTLPKPKKKKKKKKAKKDDKSSGDKKTIAGMPAVAMSANDETKADANDETTSDDDTKAAASDEDGETPSIIIDDPELLVADEDGEPEEAGAKNDKKAKAKAKPPSLPGKKELDDRRQTEPTDDGGSKTLMMGSASEAEADDDAENAGDKAPEDSSESEAKSDDETADDDSSEDSESKSTLLMGKVDDGWGKLAAETGAKDADEADGGKADADDNADADDKADEAPQDEDKTDASTQADEADEADEADDEPAETEQTDASEQTDEADEADSTVSAPSGAPKAAANPADIGFVEVENDGGGEFADDWFSSDADDVWDRSLVDEHLDRSETLRKTITFGVMGLLVVCGLGIVIYSQFGGGDTPSKAKQEQAAADDTDTPTTDDDPAKADDDSKPAPAAQDKKATEEAANTANAADAGGADVGPAVASAADAGSAPAVPDSDQIARKVGARAGEDRRQRPHRQARQARRQPPCHPSRPAQLRSRHGPQARREPLGAQTQEALGLGDPDRRRGRQARQQKK